MRAANHTRQVEQSDSRGRVDRNGSQKRCAVWAAGGHPRVLFTFSASGGKITGIGLTAEPGGLRDPRSRSRPSQRCTHNRWGVSTNSARDWELAGTNRE